MMIPIGLYCFSKYLLRHLFARTFIYKTVSSTVWSIVKISLIPWGKSIVERSTPFYAPTLRFNFFEADLLHSLWKILACKRRIGIFFFFKRAIPVDLIFCMLDFLKNFCILYKKYWHIEGESGYSAKEPFLLTNSILACWVFLKTFASPDLVSFVIQSFMEGNLAGPDFPVSHKTMNENANWILKSQLLRR